MFFSRQAKLQRRLVEAKAKLARYKKTPEGDFTAFPGHGGVIRHGVDEKPLAIARVEAEIAELEVRLNPNNDCDC